MPYIIEIYDESSHKIESVEPIVYPDKRTAFRAAKSNPYYDTTGEAPYLLRLKEVEFHPWGWGLYSIDAKTGQIKQPPD